MKKHMWRIVFVLAIVALGTTFAESAFAAPRHHHHQQAQHFSGVVGRTSYAPRLYAPSPNYSGYGSSGYFQGGYGAPHQDYHHGYYQDYHHQDYHYDYHHDYHHDSHHGW